MIAHTLQAWATAMGMERRTLEARLVKSGITVKAKGGKYSAKAIYVALVGDKDAETIRNLKADADRKEREEKEASGELVRMSEIGPAITNVYVVPMANIMASAATTLDTRCNPDHPEIARKAIEDWLENTVKPALKVELQKR